MKGSTYVLIDFDGVLADSFAIASALARRVCRKNTPDIYRSAFEGNIYDTFDRKRAEDEGHGEDCDHDLDWWGEYEKSFAGVNPFEGTNDVVKRLAEGHTLIIVTSGHRRFIDPFLEKNGIADKFADVLDVDVHTHKTKKIEMIFEKYGTDARHCVFITDTLGDVREASHHSMGAIACSWGFHPKETLEKGVPFRIVDKPVELPDAVDDYFTKLHSPAEDA